MTTRTLGVDLTKFRAYLFYRLNALRGFFIVQMILSLFTYPLVCVFWSMYASAEINVRELERLAENGSPEYELQLLQAQSYYDYTMMFAVISLIVGALCVIAVFVVGYIAHIKSFSWLYKKERVDMDYSLPVSSDTRFWGSFISGAAVTFVPFALATVFGSVYLGNYDWEWYVNAVMPDSVTAYSGSFEIIGAIIALIWAVIIAFFIFYAFTTLVMSVCGRLGHAAVMPFVLTFSVFAIHVLSLYLAEICRFGSYTNLSIGSMSVGNIVSLGYDLFDSINKGLLGSTSYCFGETAPGLLLMALSRLKWSLDLAEGARASAIAQPECIVQMVLAVVISVLGAWLLVRRRGGECVGSAYVFRPAKYVAQSVITMAITILGAVVMLCSYNYWITLTDIENDHELIKAQSDTITAVIVIAAIIAAAVVFLITELLSGGKRSLRGAKKLGFAGIRFAGAVGASCIICIIMINSNGFGMQIPGMDDVAFASVDMYVTPYSRNSGKYLYDPKGIALLEEQIKRACDEKPYNTGFEGLKEGYIGINRPDGKNVFEVSYITKRGYRRSYRFYTSDKLFREITDALATPEVLLSEYHDLRYFDRYRCEPIERDEKEEITSISVGFGGNSEQILLTNGLLVRTLYDAIAADCEKASPERLNRNTAGTNVRYINLYYGAEGRNTILEIYPWFENTLSLLGEYGVSIDFSVDISKYKTGFIIRNTNGAEGTCSGSSFREGLRLGLNIQDMFGLAGDERYEQFCRKYYNYYKFSDTDETDVMAELYDRWRGVSVKKLDLSSETAVSLIEKCGGVSEPLSRDTEYYVLLVDDDGSFMETYSEETYDRPGCEALFVAEEYVGYAEEVFNSLT